MKRELALQLLRKILPESTWDEDRFQKIFTELGTLAELKYDRYEMFQPGRLFFENLYAWLLKFEESERSDALEFVRNNLIFISREEFEQLTQIIYHDRIRQSQFDRVSALTKIPRFKVSLLAENEIMNRVQRTSLFVAMSDGARIDYFRRQNLEVTNEQVLPSYAPSESKINDVLQELEKDRGAGSKFECLYLIDDFSASGRTLLREVVSQGISTSAEIEIPASLKSRIKFNKTKQEIELAYNESGITETEKAELLGLSDSTDYADSLKALFKKHERRETRLKGSLIRMAEDGLFDCLTEDAEIFFCPSLITEYALKRLRSLISRIPDGRLANLRILPGAIIQDKVRIGNGNDAHGKITALCEKYYSAELEDEHTGSVVFGYDGCGLPIVLHHNTPNNSIYLLWARKWNNPLFARYERHGRKAK